MYYFYNKSAKKKLTVDHEFNLVLKTILFTLKNANNNIRKNRNVFH